MQERGLTEALHRVGCGEWCTCCPRTDKGVVSRCAQASSCRLQGYVWCVSISKLNTVEVFLFNRWWLPAETAALDFVLNDARFPMYRH